MGYFSRKLVKLFTITFVCLFVGMTLLRLSSMFFPQVPSPSATFDCDDSALAMYRHFQGLGIASTPIIGNLKMTGEAYAQSDHVWLLVKSAGLEIAYDWGTPRFDRQHYEGYKISLDYLLQAVQQDQVSSGILASSGQ